MLEPANVSQVIVRFVSVLLVLHQLPAVIHQDRTNKDYQPQILRKLEILNIAVIGYCVTRRRTPVRIHLVIVVLLSKYCPPRHRNALPRIRSLCDA